MTRPCSACPDIGTDWLRNVGKRPAEPRATVTDTIDERRSHAFAAEGGGTRTAKRSAQLRQREHTGCPKGFYQSEFPPWPAHKCDLPSC